MFAAVIHGDGLALRQAGVSDLATLAVLRDGDVQDSLLRDGETQALLSGGLLVAEEDGHVVAGISVRVAGVPGSAKGADALLHWTVLRSRRMEGIGRRVALAVAARVVDAGCDGIIAMTAPDDAGALAHLRAVGFDVGEGHPGKRSIGTMEPSRVLELSRPPMPGPH